MDFLKRNRFNAIRLLFNHDYVMKNDIVHAPEEATVLFQTRYIDMFLVLAREAAARGILVMVACHRIKHDAWPGAGLWYDESLGFPEARVLESWTKLAGALCGQWNIFAADLQNEPHASSWGKQLPTDWNHAAERIGNHVLSHCPRWLIMVEGVGYTPGAPNGDDPGAGFWWGENLVGARVAPVYLRDQTKLVYSPHVYGPSVYQQHYFESPLFPTNMPGVWDEHFAFAQKETGRPIVLGEIGGKYSDQDRQWQDWALPYMAKQGFGLFYFALNPDSEDTGGLVLSDWSVPKVGSLERDKLTALAIFPSTDVWAVCPRCNSSSSTEVATGSSYAFAALVVFLLMAGVLCLLNFISMCRAYKANRDQRKTPLPVATCTAGAIGKPPTCAPGLLHQKTSGAKKKAIDHVGTCVGPSTSGSEIAPLVDDSSQDELSMPKRQRAKKSSECSIDDLPPPPVSKQARRGAETSKPSSKAADPGVSAQGSKPGSLVEFGSTSRGSQRGESRRSTDTGVSPASTDSNQLVMFGSISRRGRSSSQTASTHAEPAVARGASRANRVDSPSTSNGSLVLFGKKRSSSRGEPSDEAESRLLLMARNTGEKSSAWSDVDFD